MSFAAELLLKFSETRFARHMDSDLPALFAQPPEFAQIDPLVLARFFQFREALVQWLDGQAARDEIVAAHADQLLRYCYHRNQFIRVDPADRAAAIALYDWLWDAFAQALRAATSERELAAMLADVLGRHQKNIAAFVRASRAFAPFFAGGPLPREVLCREYTPGLQLAVLNLSVDELAEPILDVGCGESALLVAHLRALGKNAHGLDRLAPDRPACVRNDWLDVELVPDTWGAILAHMSFSHHFRHAHLHDAAAAKASARLMMKMLESLKPGGVFAYAPGLPFFEPLLPAEKYRVRRFGARAEGALYTCHIERLR